jgi:hypothetical protein
VVVQAQLLGVESLIVFHNFIVLTTCFDPYFGSSSGHTPQLAPKPNYQGCLQTQRILETSHKTLE